MKRKPFAFSLSFLLIATALIAAVIGLHDQAIKFLLLDPLAFLVPIAVTIFVSLVFTPVKFRNIDPALAWLFAFLLTSSAMYAHWVMIRCLGFLDPAFPRPFPYPDHFVQFVSDWVNNRNLDSSFDPLDFVLATLYSLVMFFSIVSGIVFGSRRIQLKNDQV